MSVRVGEMEENKLGARAVLVVIVVGILCALAGVASAYFVTSNAEPRFRAETQVALLPARNTPPTDLSNYWEALSRGQAARIAAEVLGQRRWLAPAAQSAGVPAASVKLTAGAVADTTLIDVALEASSPAAAEAALDRVVVEARPVVEDVSGPFALEVVQSAAGSAKELGAETNQLLAVSGAAGLLIGGGVALLVIRSRARRAARRAAASAEDEELDAVDVPAQRQLKPAEPVVVEDATMAIVAQRPNGHAVNGRVGVGAAARTPAGEPLGRRPSPVPLNGRPTPGRHERPGAPTQS